MSARKDFSKDIAIDLETTGTVPGCAILSIGACTLDGVDTFYIKIDLQSCYHAGLGDGPETMKWWDKQAPEARSEAFSGGQSLENALCRLEYWYLHVSNGNVYGNGVSFDNAILLQAYKVLFPDDPPPWHYSKDLCLRTLRGLPNLPEYLKPKFAGTKHNALHDAIHQAEWTNNILTYITQLQFDQ